VSAADVRAAVETAFRDYTTAGVPGSGAHEPQKAEIREALGRLLQITLEAISVGFASYATIGARDADTAGPAGKIGYVYRNGGSATDGANGFYQWTGGAWEAAGWLNSLIESEVDSYLGGAKYAPRIVPTYGAQTLIPLAERFLGMRVYVEEAGLWFEYEPDDYDPENPPPGNVGYKLAREFANNRALFLKPPIVDGDRLYFPPFYMLSYGQVGYGTLYDGGSAGLLSAQVAPTLTPRRHVFDRDLYDAAYAENIADGMSADDARHAASRSALTYYEGNTTLFDTQRKVILAITRDGQLVDARGYTFIGDAPGGAVPNQFSWGRQMDDAPYIIPGATVEDIPDADLIAMGFTRGVRSEAGVPFFNVGDYRDAPIKAGDYVVARFFLYAEADGQFGIPNVGLFTNNEYAIQTPPLFMTVVREINPRVREYWCATRAPADGNGKWVAGSNLSGVASRVWLTGLQFYSGTKPGFWISSRDFPDPVDLTPVMGDELFVVSDRPAPFFPGNSLLRRNGKGKAELTVTPAILAPSPPYQDGGAVSDLFWLDPAQVGGRSLVMTLRGDDNPNVLYERTVPVSARMVPLSAPIDINILALGDSLTAANEKLVADLKLLLPTWNINPHFFGTLDISGVGDKGEGRPGWSLLNYFGLWPNLGDDPANPVYDNVLGAGTVATAAYLDPAIDRMRTNPFLNNGTSGSACPVIPGSLPKFGGGTGSGFRFDLANYRDRFALPTIDVVLVNLFSNDTSKSTGVDDVVTYTPYLLAEIRRAFPLAKILDWADASTFINGTEIMHTRLRQALQGVISAVRAKRTAGDANMHFVSAFMHRTIRGGFTRTEGTTDAATQVTKARIADNVHGRYPANSQMHEAVAAAIANLV